MESDSALARDARSVSELTDRRILWLIDSLTAGGAEALVLPFARRAAAEGLELTVCARTTIAGNPFETALRAEGARVENLGARKLFDRAAYRRLSALIEELEPSLLHTHLTYANIWGALAARRYGIPFVASLHVAPARNAGWREALRQRLMVWLLHRYADRVIVVSRALGERWRAESSLIADRLVVVYNGIEIDRFDPGSEAILPERSDREEKAMIVSVAVLRPAKGIDLLLRAVARLAERGREPNVVIVGDGPMREEWQRLAEELGVADRVDWTAHVEDVAPILAGADLFVLPTLEDAFPTVLLEAFASGLPVVASNVGGVPEIVETGVNGLLVPPGDVDELASAIDHALSDDEWRSRAKASARERAVRHFSAERWVERLVEVYDSAAREAG